MKGSAVKTKVDIPDGEYNALWGGSNLKILDSQSNVIAETSTYISVKCMNCPTKVKVKKGKVTFISQQ